MSLRKLIEGQKIIIDDHKRGNGEIKDWDNPANDIHIDKTTNFKVDGSRQAVRIRVPINSERPIKIQNSRKQQLNEVPRKLRTEIQNALGNKETRDGFVSDIVDTLRNYNTVLNSEARVRQVLENLSKHFDLRWTQDTIRTYANDILLAYTQLYTDKDGRSFYITADRQKITIAENNGASRFQRRRKAH